ncbi:MAG: tRNA (adenosine(37)-N6)-threonylcarbamoyltransferase complex ATPase subunit type 1 TsaE [Candidatus Gastranaerophilales bacterium]|nr:tRNA (adenosine(37)-N6)-threonylcarbamoyltransferase complex ATPase subunit type 1 TsaE [Candidatus Gastranaerophilales bacterium]
MTCSLRCENIADTEKIAKKFAEIVSETGAFVCLHGDIGAGKTAFTKLVCKYLDVKQKVTSPSFVILNEYKSGKLPVYHFDLYRLESEGVSTVTDELSEYSEGKILTMVEWAEFSPDTELPFDRVIVNITYLNETEREFDFSAIGEKSEKIVEKMAL